MHRAHSAALWYFSPGIFFFSQSLSSLRQEFLKWVVVWKRFVVSGSSSWWKFAELEPWNVAAVSEELGLSSESHCLAAGQMEGEHWLTSSHPLFIILFLGIPFTPYATLSYNTFYVILTIAFSDPQSCPSYYLICGSKNDEDSFRPPRMVEIE